MDQQDLSSVCFKDVLFLQQHGLELGNCIDYFATSPFYDQTCIREQKRMQSQFNALELDESKLVGVDYVCEQHEDLFIVRKLNAKRMLEQVYYIINGTIYKAPELEELVNSRLVLIKTLEIEALEDSRELL
jgi:mediator of RNA polymerase II transcription subunit 6